MTVQRKMKDSGIQWIGGIPENWNMQRIKTLFFERKEKNEPQQTDFILSLGASYGVIPYTEKESGGNKAKEKLTDYKLAYPDDIIINSMNIISGSVGISKYFGCVSPVYYILISKSKLYFPKYFCYFFKTKEFQRSLLGLGNGILMKESANGSFNTVRMRIPMEKLGTQVISVPPTDEQQKIANFLDQKCGEIDNIITRTKATIEEYKKLKQSVITQAVTKGIRKNRPMKDSGIDWIRKIPIDWLLIRIKWLLNERNERSVLGKEEPLSMSQKYGIIPTKQMDIIPNMASSFIGAKLCYKNDLIFNKLKAHLGVFAVSNYDGLVSPDYAVYYSTNRALLKFLEYLFKTPQYIGEFRKKSTGVGAGLTRLYTSELFSIYCAIPPICEQYEIIDYLNKKCSEIDKLIQKKEQLLDELENYKKSLIYEYVTGKKEV